MSDKNSTLAEINTGIRIMRFGYYAWFVVHVVLGIATVVLPGLAAMAVFDDVITRWLAGAGALVGAVVSFLRPYEYATGYDAGLQRAWRARILLTCDSIDVPTAGRELAKAVDLTTFRYGTGADSSAS